MNKKYIIIFGALILLLIIVVGGITYYQGRNILLSHKDGFVPEIPDDKEYEIWCWYGEAWIDCSEKSEFRPHELVSINVNLKEFDIIPYEDPYYLCYYSDLSDLGKQCFSRSASTIEGLVLIEEEVPEKDVFNLIRISVYPDNNFSEDDEIVIMDLEGKSIQ
jgi:hypothetical protein